MLTLYVTSDQEYAGRTSICVTMASDISKKGKKVAVFKPFSASPNDGSGKSDREILLSVSNIESNAEGSWPFDWVGSDNLDSVVADFQKCTTGAEVSVIEGLSSITADFGQTSSQLVERIDARVVVVIAYVDGLGLESVQVAKELFGQRLEGIIINGVTKYKMREMQNQLAPMIEAIGVKVLAIVPESRVMLGFTVGELARHLGGTFLNSEDKSESLIEHYLIGGMVLDWGVLYFERFANKAVIVRGDRPDIQMAALKTPTSCIVLTGGFEPIQYVQYEAGEEEVPLISVNSDTLQTASSLESLHGKAIFGHPAKVEQFAHAVNGNGNLEGFYLALGV